MHAKDFLDEAAYICEKIDYEAVESMAAALSKVEGRVYLVGLGGSLANCIHMAADLRNLCAIDAYAPSNIAMLTATANDHGWDNMFQVYMQGMNQNDALFVLSVGGGTNSVSSPIVWAVTCAKLMRSKIFGIVGPNGGVTVADGDHVIRIPVQNPRHVTPHTEAFQAVLWHALVSHPLLQKRPTKW